MGDAVGAVPEAAEGVQGVQGVHSPQAQRVRRVGRWCAGAGFVVAVAIPAVWLFLPYPSLRRWLVLAGLGCAAVCLGVLARQRGAAGSLFGGWAADGPGTTRFTPVTAGAAAGSPAVPPLPRVLPSRRVQQLRVLAWGVGVTAGLIGLVALGLGRPQPSDEVQRIVAAGPEFGEARVLAVGRNELHDPSRGTPYYTASAVVRLRGSDGARGAARVYARSATKVRPGDRTTVLYAPSDVTLGAVGSRPSLPDESAGRTFSPFTSWAFVAMWAVGVAVAAGLLLQRLGRGSFGRLQPGFLAARGTCVGVREAASLTVETAGAGHRSVQFLTPFDARAVPDSVKGQPLWLSWEQPPRSAKAPTGSGADGSGGRSAAVLVLDTGLVVHGMLARAEAEALGARVAVSPEAAENTLTVAEAAEAGLVAETRTLKAWDPRCYWPASVSRFALGVAGLSLLGAAVLTYDIGGFARWVVGAVTVLCGLAVPAAFTEGIRGKGPA